jgi:hypothetical protein
VPVNPFELYEEIKVAEVPEDVPVFGDDDITVGIDAEVNFMGIPDGMIEIIVGVGSESAPIAYVQIFEIEGSQYCAEGNVNRFVQVEVCLSGTIDDNDSIDFSVDLSIVVDPCPNVPCPFKFSTEINCKIVNDGFDASLECKL